MLSPAFSQKMLKALPTSTDYFLAFLFLQSIFLTHLQDVAKKTPSIPASRKKQQKHVTSPHVFITHPNLSSSQEVFLDVET